jgi:hypothetical protein
VRNKIYIINKMAEKRKKRTKRTSIKQKQSQKQVVNIKIGSKRSGSGGGGKSAPRAQDPILFRVPPVYNTNGLQPDREPNTMVSRIDELTNRQTNLFAQSHQQLVNEIRRLRVDPEGIRLAGVNPNKVAAEQFAATLGQQPPQQTNPSIQLPQSSIQVSTSKPVNDVFPIEDRFTPTPMNDPRSEVMDRLGLDNVRERRSQSSRKGWETRRLRKGVDNRGLDTDRAE